MCFCCCKGRNFISLTLPRTFFYAWLLIDALTVSKNKENENGFESFFFLVFFRDSFRLLSVTRCLFYPTHVVNVVVVIEVSINTPIIVASDCITLC